MPWADPALFGGDRSLGASEPDAWLLLVLEGMKAREEARYAEAEPLLARALREAEQTPSNADRVATAANNLGLLYHDQGRLVDAQVLYRRA
ncbi:MAG: tetratricopeptide repeat protein, partial [Nitrospiraceae bacterium]